MCNQCDIGFKRQNEFFRHQRTKHSTDTISLVCVWPGCTFATVRKDKLKAHIDSRHKRLETVGASQFISITNKGSENDGATAANMISPWKPCGLDQVLSAGDSPFQNSSLEAPSHDILDVLDTELCLSSCLPSVDSIDSTDIASVNQPKKHACKGCGAKFTRGSDLKRHINKHDRTQGYTCKLGSCKDVQRFFYRKDKAMDHLHKIHNSTSSGDLLGLKKVHDTTTIGRPGHIEAAVEQPD